MQGKCPCYVLSLQSLCCWIPLVQPQERKGMHHFINLQKCNPVVTPGLPGQCPASWWSCQYVTAWYIWFCMWQQNEALITDTRLTSWEMYGAYRAWYRAHPAITDSRTTFPMPACLFAAVFSTCHTCSVPCQLMSTPLALAHTKNLFSHSRKQKSNSLNTEQLLLLNVPVCHLSQKFRGYRGCKDSAFYL